MSIGKPHNFIMATILLAVAGCSSYPRQVEEIKTDLQSHSGAKRPTYDLYSTESGGNKLLALMERGRLEQLLGNYKASSKDYAEAIKINDEFEDKALLSVGDAFESTMAVTYGNDLALDYPVLGFERMMLHVLDAFDRLAMNDLDGFGVNCRNLERCRGMIKARLDREKELIEREGGEIRHGEYDSPVTSESYKSFMQEMEKLAPGLQHSIDNVYALFLMGLYREMRGDFNEAISHYTEIQSIWPNNPAVAKSIERCSKARAKAGSGDIIIFLEEGFIPPKRTRHEKFGSGALFATLYMTLPNYATADCLPYQDGGPLVIAKKGQYIAHTELLCDLAPLAVKAHEERLEGIIARKALTSGMTSGMIHINNMFNGYIHSNPIVEALALCGGFFSAIVADIMVAANERPDMRSWCLLPRQVQVARFSVKSGRHDLALMYGNEKAAISVDVKNKGWTIIHCMASSGKLVFSSASIGGKRDK